MKLKRNKKLKLKIELVPSTAWENNLRKILPRSVWQELRKEIIKKAKNKCQICGATGKMDCHEVWKYDDKNHIQELVNLQAICSMCHMVKHFGFSTLRLHMPQEKLVKHFMQVNKCSRKDFIKHLSQETQKFNERSQYEWQISIPFLNFEKTLQIQK